MSRCLTSLLGLCGHVCLGSIWQMECGRREECRILEEPDLLEETKFTRVGGVWCELLSKRTGH